MQRLANVDLASYFDSIVGGEIALKPGLKSYEAVAEMCGFKTYDCTMVEDNLTNVIGAFNAGMDSIFFDPNGDEVGKLLVKKRVTDLRKIKEMF